MLSAWPLDGWLWGSHRYGQGYEYSSIQKQILIQAGIWGVAADVDQRLQHWPQAMTRLEDKLAIRWCGVALNVASLADQRARTACGARFCARGTELGQRSIGREQFINNKKNAMRRVFFLSRHGNKANRRDKRAIRPVSFDIGTGLHFTVGTIFCLFALTKAKKILLEGKGAPPEKTPKNQNKS